MWRQAWDTTRNVVFRATSHKGWGTDSAQFSDIVLYTETPQAGGGVIHGLDLVKVLSVFSIESSDPSLADDAIGWAAGDEGCFKSVFVFYVAYAYCPEKRWPKGSTGLRSVPGIAYRELKNSFQVAPVSYVAGCPAVLDNFDAPILPEGAGFNARTCIAAGALRTNGIMYVKSDVNQFSRAVHTCAECVLPGPGGPGLPAN